MQGVAREILTDWGFDLLKNNANDVFMDRRAAHGLLIKPPGYSSGASLLPPQCLHLTSTSRVQTVWSSVSCVLVSSHARSVPELPPCYAGTDVPIVLFCHGFSQPIQNYTGTLQRIATQAGALVIGPETTLFDSLGAVAGSASGWLGELAAAPPTKLQARPYPQQRSMGLACKGPDWYRIYLSSPLGLPCRQPSSLIPCAALHG